MCLMEQFVEHCRSGFPWMDSGGAQEKYFSRERKIKNKNHTCGFKTKQYIIGYFNTTALFQ